VAQRELNIYLNQYQAGTVAFTAVVVAQAPVLGSEESSLAVRQNRFLAAVALIETLGGGWDTDLLPSSVALEMRNPITNPFILRQ
jgi:outer membrane protein TolC